MHLTWHIWHIVEATLGLNPTPTPSDQLLSPGPYMATRYGPAFTLHLCPPRSSHSHSFALELYLQYLIYLFETIFVRIRSTISTENATLLWATLIPDPSAGSLDGQKVASPGANSSPPVTGHRRSPSVTVPRQSLLECSLASVLQADIVFSIETSFTFILISSFIETSLRIQEWQVISGHSERTQISCFGFGPN